MFRSRLPSSALSCSVADDVERGWLEAFAAGALIALVVETMAPEAVHGHPGFTGLLAMLGFSALLLALVK